MKASQKQEMIAEVNQVFKRTLQSIKLMTVHLKQGQTFEEEQIISAKLEAAMIDIVSIVNLNSDREFPDNSKTCSRSKIER